MNLLKAYMQTECWNWPRTKNLQGYGTTYDPVAMKTVLAHRYLYECLVGSIPEGMELCHKCDNPACVNPEHMFIGTHKENFEDMMAKGSVKMRGRWRATRTLKLSDEQVVEIRNLAGTMTQTAIAKKYGVRQTHISRILRGKRRREG